MNQRITQFLRDNPPALRLVAQGPRTHPWRDRRAERRRTDLRRHDAAVAGRDPSNGRLRPDLPHHRRTARRCRVEFNVQNQYFPEGKTSYVTVAEIPGTDKADEVVMLGGHLDSWTSATGATDNAIGCAIMMEAARILEAIGAKPRRTIRVALWSGEEEGLARIARLREAPLRLGRERRCRTTRGSTPTGISTTGPAACAARRSSGRRRRPACSRSCFKPFEEWGVYGAVGLDRPRGRRQRQRRVRRRRPAGHRRAAGSDRIQQHHLAHQSRHLRADRARRCDEERGDHRIGRAPHRQPRAMMPRFSKADMPPIPARRGAFGRGGRGDAASTESRVFAGERNRPLSIPAPGLIPPAAPSADAAAPR